MAFYSQLQRYVVAFMIVYTLCLSIVSRTRPPPPSTALYVLHAHAGDAIHPVLQKGETGILETSLSTGYALNLNVN